MIIIRNILIYIIVPILCIICTCLCFKINKSKSKFSTNDSLYIAIVILIMLISCLACFFIGFGMLNIKVNSNNLPPDEATLKAIVDQQSRTLTIASFSVAMVSLINTILSVFRDKKLQKDQKNIEELKTNIEQMEATIKTIASISAIQILESKDSECYYDMINQYLKILEKNEHSKLALLSLKATISRSEKGKQLQEVSCYNDIINIASIILKSSDSPVDRQFALLESVNALYKRARIKLYEGNAKDAKEDLETAKEQLVMLSALNPIDTFGHVFNLIGLVHFWTAKVESSDSKFTELQSAERFFSYALNKCSNKPEYLNHMGVTKINLYEYSPKEYLFTEIKDIYRNIISNNPNYFKAYTNLAHIYMDRFKYKFNILDYMPLSAILSQDHTHDIIEEADKILIEAEKYLNKALELAPKFIDNHYKYGALLTYKYLLKKLEDNNYYDLEYERNIIKHFNQADSIMKDATKTLVYKRNFYEITGDVNEARKINNILIERKDKFALKWNEYFNK